MTDNFPSPHVAGKNFDRNIFVSSDWHLSHAKIIEYSKRPFATVDEMNEAIIERHNAVVRDKDIIYNLGDVYFGMAGKHLLGRFKGRKRLILGNHDAGKDSFLHQHFQKILVWRMFPEYKILLTHVPVHEGSLQDKVRVNVHGHLHNNLVTDYRKTSEWGEVYDDRYINVCVEHTNYAPVNIEELAKRVPKG